MEGEQPLLPHLRRGDLEVPVLARPGGRDRGHAALRAARQALGDEPPAVQVRRAALLEVQLPRCPRGRDVLDRQGGLRAASTRLPAGTSTAFPSLVRTYPDASPVTLTSVRSGNAWQ